MQNYEAMFIVKPELGDTDKKTLFNQINDSVLKNNGTVSQGNVWAERRKLYFSIKKYNEGVYYLMNFTISTDMITKLKGIYKLNENILRVLITRVE